MIVARVFALATIAGGLVVLLKVGAGVGPALMIIGGAALLVFPWGAFLDDQEVE